MNKIEHVTESLKLVYESVQDIPTVHQQFRGEAIAYLLSRGWVTENTANCLGAASEANIIKSQIDIAKQELAKTKNLKNRFQLTDSIASCYEKLFAIEAGLEDNYRAELENVFNEFREAQPKVITDSVLDDLQAEATKLESEFKLLQEQVSVLQQEFDNAPSDKKQKLVQQLADLQKAVVAADRQLLHNRQAISLNKLGAPKRLKKLRLAQEISHIKLQQFLNELISFSLERSRLVLQIRSNLTKAIADAATMHYRILRQAYFNSLV